MGKRKERHHDNDDDDNDESSNKKADHHRDRKKKKKKHKTSSTAVTTAVIKKEEEEKEREEAVVKEESEKPLKEQRQPDATAVEPWKEQQSSITPKIKKKNNNDIISSNSNVVSSSSSHDIRRPRSLSTGSNISLTYADLVSSTANTAAVTQQYRQKDTSSSTATTTHRNSSTSTTSTTTTCTYFQKRVQLTISLLPYSLHNITAAIRASLRKRLLRYDRGWGGILLAFDKVQFLQKDTNNNSNITSCSSSSSSKAKGWILNELPYIHYHVDCDILVFAPTVGCQVSSCYQDDGRLCIKHIPSFLTYYAAPYYSQNIFFLSFFLLIFFLQLQGRVNECFPSHVSILVFGYINAMISADTLFKAGLRFDHDSQSWMAINTNEMDVEEIDIVSNGHHSSLFESISKNMKLTFVVSKIHECDSTISLEGKSPMPWLLVDT
jgi:hypothetical protein